MSQSAPNENKPMTKRNIPEVKNKLKRFDRLACCFFLFGIFAMSGILVTFALTYRPLSSHHEVSSEKHTPQTSLKMVSEVPLIRRPGP